MDLEVIDGNILHSRSRGFLRKEHIGPIEELRGEVNEALAPGGVDYFIAGVKNLEKSDRMARRLYMESLRKWHEHRPIRMYINYGVNRFMRAAVNLARPFMPFKVRLADDLESALLLVEKQEKKRARSSGAADAEPDERAVFDEYVDDILKYIGRIDWEADGIDSHDETDPYHPLAPVYDAIDRVKGELDSIFKERKRIEDALRESEARFDEILGHSRDILFKRNVRTGGYEYISRAVTALFGYTPRESDAMGYNGFVKRMHPDDRKNYRTFMDAFLKTAPDETIDPTIEYRLRARDGSYRWLKNSHTLLRNSAGRPRFVIGTSRDITESKNAEIALKDQHERFLTIMDSIDASIYVTDMETHEILFINKRMKDELGRDPVGEPCWKALHGGDGPCGECMNRELLDEDGRPTEEGCAWEEKDPATGRWRLNHDRAIEWVDGRHARLEIATDISRIKTLEEGRRKTEEARRHSKKLEAMGAMAEGIAHNFNNILMAVMGNLDLVLMDLSPGSPIEYNLKAAEEAAGKAAELSTLMMTYVGQGAGRKQTIDMTELIAGMKESLEDQFSRKATLKFPPSPFSAPFKGDPDQIRQVVVNLVSNASEALQETGGEITLSTGVAYRDRAWFKRQLLKEEAPDGHYVFLEVTDNGPGMDKETIDKVSDPFFTTKFTGRGLGMAAVAGIVRGHKGAITLESEPGKGVVVRTLFPALKERLHGMVRPKSAPLAEPGRKSGKVLLVDDEEVALTVGKAMLEKLGFRVLTARDGIEAVDVFRKRAAEIRLVVLDITMPRMDGGRAFREMRKIDPGVRALISSGYTEGRMAAQFENAPPAGFIHKPFKLREFSRKIKEIIDGK